MASAKFQTRQTIQAYLEKFSDANAGKGMLPLHFAVDRGKLVLYGTDNISERDTHSICRIGDEVIQFEGAVEVQGHLTGGGVTTKGEGANINLTGYVSGDSEKNPVRLIAKDSAISLGDTNHNDRRTLIYAHIEAANGVTIYKRPLIHSTIISHYEDAILRGQVMQNSSITAPYISLSASICKGLTVHARQDVVIKSGEISRCNIQVEDGEAVICAGSIRNCDVFAKFDIELTGNVDAYTLAHARSEKGEVRYDGKPVSAAGRKRATSAL